jgi:glycosyltransferase involved in cell wall biosynthesis
MKILFITHNTALAGAPKVLLLFLQWLAVHKPLVEIHVLDMAPGVMEPDFRACSNGYYVFPKRNSEKNFIVKAIRKMGLLSNGKDAKTKLLHLLGKQNFDFIYANTIKTVPVAVQIKANTIRTKIILHIHELPTVIKLLLPDFPSYTNYIDGIIAASEIIKIKLIKDYDVSEKKIQTVYAFSEAVPISGLKKTKEIFNVGASGFVDWRKGYDIFIQVSRHIKKHQPKTEIIFTWVGPIPEDTQTIIEADLAKLDIQKNIFFVGLQENPWSYYGNFDVFLMPSREDPFPLVAIELAMLQKPIICFENAVGTSEILSNGGGKIVPYLDIEAMAQAVLEYYNDRALCDNDGKMASQLFKPFTPQVQCPKIYAILENHFENKSV